MRNRRVVVHSGHSTGKSYVCSDIVLWFMKAFGGTGLCKVITTAPKMDQVTGILWRTLRRRYNASRIPLGGRLLPKAPEWEFGEEYFAQGLTASEPEKMLGFHSPYLLVVIDEAAGVDADIWDATMRLATGEMNFVLAISNPGGPEGPFYEACMEDPSWYTIHLSSLDHPNVTNDFEIVPGAATVPWVEAMETRYGGRDSPLFQAFVEGIFPSEGLNTVMTPAIVDPCFELHHDTGNSSLVTMGLDVARFGQDENVLTVMHGNNVVDTKRWLKKPATFTQGVVADECNKFSGPQWDLSVVVDADGVGGPVADNLAERGVPVRDFNGGLAPFYSPRLRGRDARQERYTNMRTQAWFELADDLRDRQVGLAQVKERKRLRAQLTGPQYKFKGDGRLALESKDDIAKRNPRLGSPDRADSLVMCNWGRRYRGVYIPQERGRDERTWRNEYDELTRGH